MKIDPLGNQLSPVRTSYAIVPREDEPRTLGLHQSAIANRLMVALGTYEASDFDWDRMMMGQLMEAQVEAMLSGVFIDNHQLQPSSYWGRVIRPGEFSVDTEVGPIYVTPDGYDVGHNANHELKATWYSAKKPFTDPEFLGYRIQMKLACMALGCLDSFLHVYYVNGNYAPPRPWPIQSFHFSFTETELHENVEMLVQFVKARPQLFPEAHV